MSAAHVIAARDAPRDPVKRRIDARQEALPSDTSNYGATGGGVPPR